MKALQPRHYAWIVDWALEECTNLITASEMEIVRLKDDIKAPIYDKHGLGHAGHEPSYKTRPAQIKERQERLAEYRDIHDFLCELKEKVMDAAATANLADLAQFFAQQKRRKS